MRLLESKIWSLSLLVLTWGAGCSDDGVPADSATGDASTAGTSSATAEGSGGSVSTATASVSDTADTNDPTAPTSSGTGSLTDGSESTDSGPGSTATGTETNDTGTDTGGRPMTCESAADCVLIDDCCTCMAAHSDDRPPACPERECDQSACDAAGIGGIGVECQFDVCQLEEVDCNQLEVVCDAPTPECPDGQLPSVDNGCWTFDCVPAEACNYVPDCEWCGDQACIHTFTQIGTLYGCEPIPESCGGAPTCDCMPGACDMAPFDTCADGQNGITCSCPAC